MNQEAFSTIYMDHQIVLNKDELTFQGILLKVKHFKRYYFELKKKIIMTLFDIGMATMNGYKLAT